LTKFRAGLTPLEAFDRDSAGIVINQISRWQKKFMKTRGRRTVYASDEFYALSGRRWPGDAFYGGYPQLENGVGMTALFKKQFNDGLSRVKRGEFNAKFGAPANVPGPSYIFTGQAAAAMIGQCVEKLQAMFACMDITVIPVENAFFGEKVTVSGLLTGRDIENKAKTIDFPPKSRIFISKTMLKYGSNVFLDNYSIQMLQNILKIDIIAVENDGYALVRALLS
jgi:NifB/MoaA-like Fe-S oxidoreductase